MVEPFTFAKLGFFTANTFYNPVDPNPIDPNPLPPLYYLYPYWTPLDPVGPHWIPLDPIGPHWTPLDPIGPHWTPLDPIGPHWTPPLWPSAYAHACSTASTQKSNMEIDWVKNLQLRKFDLQL